MNDVKGPVSLSFDITNRCNLKCLHCYNSSGEGDFESELSNEEVDKIINDIIEIKPFSVCICGGEPLLRKNIVVDSVKKLTSNGIRCSMVTNGMFLTDDLASSLYENGISNIQISLDGKEDSHNKLRCNKKAYEGAINALGILKKCSIVSGIAFSPTKWNIDDFEFVYSLAIKYGCNEIRLQELMPIGRASQNEEILPSEVQYNKLRRLYLKKKRDYIQGKTDLDIFWGDPIDHILSFSSIKSDSCLTESISIFSDGSISSSVYLPVTFGNLKDHSLSDYWTAGLSHIWNSSIIQEYSNRIDSITDMINPGNNKILQENIDLDLIKLK